MRIRVLMGVLAMASLVTVTWAAGTEDKSATAATEKKEAKAQSVYVCPDCHTMAMKAGKCTMWQVRLRQRRHEG